MNKQKHSTISLKTKTKEFVKINVHCSKVKKKVVYLYNLIRNERRKRRIWFSLRPMNIVVDRVDPVRRVYHLMGPNRKFCDGV